MATEQEILDAAQARLLAKRLELGAMTTPIQSIASALSDFRALEELRAEHERRQAEERRQGEEAKIKREEERKREKREHPERWLSQYGVPAKYLESSFSNFVGGEKAKIKCRQFPGKNIVLHGNTGCGKTHLAAATLREMVQNDQVRKIKISPHNFPEKDFGAKFITVPKLLMEIRDSFKGINADTERQIVDRYIGYPHLILDDLGADRATEWTIETLYLIIDGRDSGMMPTFITTNLAISEIEKHYGARIASRISGMEIVKIDMPDYRKRR